MRFGLIGFRPLHLVPLSSLPLHTLLFPLFFHVLLSSCQVSGRPGLYNELGFIGCPCALGSPLLSTTRTFVPSRPPVMSSFFCLARAHVHIGPHLSFTPPLGERVCAPCSHRDSFELFLLSRGCQGCTLDWHQEDASAASVTSIRDAGLTYLLGEKPT